MKKVKIMLTAMIILGTVGGVLAFKAKRTALYCTAAVPAGGSCTSPAVKCLAGTVRKIDIVGAERCYKVTSTTANCNADNKDCTAKDTFTAN